MQGGISDKATREQLEKFLSKLGLTEVKSTQGNGFTLASNVVSQCDLEVGSEVAVPAAWTQAHEALQPSA